MAVRCAVTRSARCATCNRRFATFGALDVHHMRNPVHTDMPFACSRCDAFFATRCARRAHMRVTHWHHVCSECRRVFNSANTAAAHLAAIHGIRRELQGPTPSSPTASSPESPLPSVAGDDNQDIDGTGGGDNSGGSVATLVLPPVVVLPPPLEARRTRSCHTPTILRRTARV